MPALALAPPPTLWERASSGSSNGSTYTPVFSCPTSNGATGLAADLWAPKNATGGGSNGMWTRGEGCMATANNVGGMVDGWFTGAIGPSMGAYGCNLTSATGVSTVTWHTAQADNEDWNAVLCAWRGLSSGTYTASIVNSPASMNAHGYLFVQSSGFSHSSSSGNSAIASASDAGVNAIPTPAASQLDYQNSPYTTISLPSASNSTSTSTSKSSSSDSNDPSSGSTGGLGTGGIIAIVVGIVALIAAVGGCAYYQYRKHNRSGTSAAGYHNNRKNRSGQSGSGRRGSNYNDNAYNSGYGNSNRSSSGMYSGGGGVSSYSGYELGKGESKRERSESSRSRRSSSRSRIQQQQQQVMEESPSGSEESEDEKELLRDAGDLGAGRSRGRR